MKNLKWKIVPVRMTEYQYENLMRAAEKDPGHKLKSGRVNLSEFMRARIFSFQYNPDQIQKKIDGLIFQFRKIGTNINQVTKKINSDFGTVNDISVLKIYLDNLQTETEKVVEFLENLNEE